MNKIVIIGNGFDLAHGLKTSYNHFLDNFIKNDTSFQSSMKSRLYQRISEIKEVIKWVDIENQYLKLMFELVNFNTPTQVNLQFIKDLNNDLFLLREKLIEYLTLEQEKKDIIPNDKYLSIFVNSIEDLNDDIIIINFNYTDTANKYISKIREIINLRFLKEDKNYTGKIQCINIHGQLNSSLEEPIFGIGDEYHIEYNKIKELDDIDEILKFSKSFWYQKNNNYQDLMKVLDCYKPSTYDGYTVENKFIIDILGHSCGLSDRTLLKNILENESVHTINLYYHPDKNDYTNKLYDIWRHFDDPHNFRMKVKPFDHRYKMPQI